MEIGVKVKVLQETRIKKGYTQRALARKAGTSHSYISQIESGDRTPGPKIAQVICNALEVNFDDIFFIKSGCKSDHKRPTGTTGE